MSTDSTHSTVAKGNSKDLRTRGYTFTLNNWTEEEKKNIEEYIKKECEEGKFQPEIGKNGTPHLQGYFYHKHPRFSEPIRKQFPRMHLEKMKSLEGSRKYCEKEETKAGEGFVHGGPKKIKDPLENKELFEWQKEIKNMIEKEPDDRKIHWFYDTNGGAGKTSLAKHLCIKYEKNILYTGGKSNDIKYGVKTFIENKENDLKMAIFDITRTQENFISYTAIEEIKNGIFYNTKYESGMCIFNTPHVIIFANFKPDETKLSKDRWIINNIGSEIEEFA